MSHPPRRTSLVRPYVLLALALAALGGLWLLASSRLGRDVPSDGTRAVRFEHAVDPFAAESADRDPTELTQWPLPTNDGKQCFGIAALAMYLLERDDSGPRRSLTPQALAAAIYRGTIERTDVPEVHQVTDDSRTVPLRSAQVLEKIARDITALYRADFDAAVVTDEGRQSLISANHVVFHTRRELVERLRQEKRRALLCTALGMREGIDESPRDIAHVVIVILAPDGELVVWDPNSPREFAKAQSAEDEDGLELSWTCKYRDQRHATTQTCVVGSVADALCWLRRSGEVGRP